MKKKITTILLCIVFLVGLSLLLYPTVSNYWNTILQTRAVADYVAQVEELDDNEYEEILSEARAYNESLLAKNGSHTLTDAEREVYEKMLKVSTSNVIGYIEIPAIGQTLAIYHGTSDEVLRAGVGHIEWSSLPVGGESTHCVLSSHRGLPSARLFSDLDMLEVGDTFMLRVLDEVLTYEVDQIRIVLPTELDDLSIVEGQDYCTLVTCTPYGVNTHRLLVRGHRVPNDGEGIRVTADALQIEPKIVAPFVALPFLLALLIWVLITTRQKKEDKQSEPQTEGGAAGDTDPPG